MKFKLTNLRYFVRRRLLFVIMRMIIFLLCTSVFSLTPKLSFSQEKVMINQDQAVTVDEVFNIIQQQTNYHFIFPKRFFKNAPSILLEKGEILVVNLLEKSLQNSNLEFEVDENNTILIKKNENSSVSQNKVTVKGKVFDTNGVPLLGVTVIEKGTSNGIATNFSGEYSISVPNNATIEFSYVGFQTKDVVVADLTYFINVDITLNEDVNKLEEVVVTGYQAIARERTAGSFDKVDVQQIQQRPSSPNIIERLTGQVSGLNINPVNNSFEIRGRSTILNDSSNPLIVVDGFPLADQQNFESINPEDIESVTILKDASASSIWGSRASNGVVVVVTKKGAKNKALTVDFSSFAEIENKVDLSDMNWLSTSQEIDLDMEFIDKGWANLSSIATGNGSINNLHMAYIYRNGLSPDGNVWSQNTFDNYINELRKRDITKDWEKYLLRNAVRTTYNLSISGGGDRNSFFGSLSYTNKLEPSIGDKNDRISMNLRNVFDFNDKISFTAGMTAVLRNQKENGLDSYYGFTGAGGSVALAGLAQPYDQLVDENGQYVQNYYNWSPWVSQDREALVGAPYTFNYLEEQRNRDVNTTRVDLRADFKLDVEVFKDLTVSSSFRYERNTDDLDNFKSMNLPSQRNFTNDYYVLESGRYVNKIPVGTEYLKENTYSKGWVFKNTITWDKSWTNHDLTVFAGGEYSRRFSEFSRNRQFGYDKQATTYQPINEVDMVGRKILNWAGSPLTKYANGIYLFDINNQDNRFVSYFSNLGYTYKQKYTLNGSFRIDQANIYGSNPDFRYKPLWSVGGAWNLDKEAFLESADWINRLKLRASYGLGGNSINSASPYPTARNRNITWGYPYITLVLSQPGNPDLKWEETATTDFGIDFAFFKNRISGSIDYYSKKSTDVYTNRSIDPTVGFASAFVNYADIDNKGVELVLNADIIRSQDFNWSVRANFNNNKNELVTLKTTNTPNPDSYTSGNAYEEGKPIGGLYGYNFAGLDANGEVLLYNIDGSTKSWRDAVEIDELVYKGTMVPKNYGGLSTTFAYKGFDLTLNANYQGGFVFSKSYNYASVGYGTGNNIDYDFSNIRMDKIWDTRWRQPGDEATTMVPKIFYNGTNPVTGLVENRYDTDSMHRIWNQSTNNIFKGDYVRIQDIILGYTMPSKFLKSTFFQGIRLTMQVANPFLWVANDLGIDPTAPDSEAYTNLTRYTLGLRATF